MARGVNISSFTVPAARSASTRPLLPPARSLFTFRGGDPMGSRRPPTSHVAISLGDGRVLEAIDGGVRIADAGDRFTDAAVMHEYDREVGSVDWGERADEVLARAAANDTLQPGEDLIELDPDDPVSLDGFDLDEMMGAGPANAAEPADAADPTEPVDAVVVADPGAVGEPIELTDPEPIEAFTAIDNSLDALLDSGFGSTTYESPSADGF